MREVKIVTLKAHAHFASYTYDEVDEVIIDMNSKGYEFKGSVPSQIYGYGAIREIKLIFEKEI